MPRYRTKTPLVRRFPRPFAIMNIGWETPTNGTIPPAMDSAAPIIAALTNGKVSRFSLDVFK